MVSIFEWEIMYIALWLRLLFLINWEPYEIVCLFKLPSYIGSERWN